MAQHIFGSGTRYPLPEPVVPTCDWLFEEDPPRFPFGGGHNPMPFISNFYLVGMPNRLMVGCSANPIFRHFQCYVTASSENTWPINSFVHLEGISLPDAANAVTAEDFPLWIPSVAQWELINGGPGSGEVDINVWLRGICGMVHPPPYDVNDPVAHENGDLGTSELSLPGGWFPELRDTQITVTAKVNGTTIGGDTGAYAVLCYGGVDNGGQSLSALYIDPLNEKTLIRADGTCVLENITRIPWDVAVIFPAHDDLVLVSMVDTELGGNIDVEADLIVP